ncbi:MAG TPA: indole-3-glycerol phosphate synthase TrpC [Bacillota bacterium]|nr:indole-3-glycerol phosphate synthase TrpC [Bacillota bacterium]
MTILDKIITEKKKEVTQLKIKPIEKGIQKDVIPFSERVKASTNISIIAEIKRSSPSKGAIQMAVDPAAQARKYEALGANAISVLTDEPFFNGTMDDLRAVRQAVDVPILCKDFMIDTIQIDHAKAAGANIILLIVAALDDQTLKNLYDYARAEDLEIIVEVHNEEEMERALKLNPEIVGINNRDLKTFTVDLKTTHRIASMVEGKDIILISESGMQEKENVVEVADFGASVVLIGETFMRSTNLEQTFDDLTIAKRIKGTT